MTNRNPNDFEEIALAIALLGGVIAILLKISDYFNNNVIPSDADFRGISDYLVIFLLMEIPIILFFFLFKGISIYTKPDCWKEKIKEFAQYLFKLSFIYFLIWLIALILTFIFIYIFKLPNHPILQPIYYSLLLILLVIIGTALIDCTIFKSISRNPYSLGEFWKGNKKIFLLLIVVIFFGLVFYSLCNLLSSYLLMGSYSIEEFLQPNDGNITIVIKETGTIYIASYINLYNLDTDFEKSIDTIRIAYHQVNFSEKGYMVGTNNDYLRKIYLNINTSKLQTGNYLLHAEVTIFESPILGTVKKQADKLFYIPPKSTNCSFNST